MLSYITQVRSLAIVVGMLEYCYQKSEHPRVQKLYQSRPNRLPMLLKDIRYFELKHPESIHGSISAALHLADEILLASQRSPISLGGYLYVLEGSMMGAKVLLPKLSESYDLSPDKGAAYFSTAETASNYWLPFTAILNEFDQSEVIELIEAAGSCMRGFKSIYGPLYPFEAKDLRCHVSTVNPEAGDHSFPCDPREYSCAMKSAVKAWGSWPYLASRFGERGLRFSKSDAAWLILLAHRPWTSAIMDIEWMASMLSARGIPSIILEEQLVSLYAETGMALEQQQYGQLLKLADHLKHLRKSVMEDSQAEAITVQYISCLSDGAISPRVHFGKVLISALADDFLGWKGGLDNILNWASSQNYCNEMTLNGIKAIIHPYR